MSKCCKGGTYKGGGMYANQAMWSTYHKNIAFLVVSPFEYGPVERC